MNIAPHRQQQFLITWFHPTEHALALDADSWVIGGNEDFGYEVTCALLWAEDEDAAIAAIRGNYRSSTPIHFRSCEVHYGPMEMGSHGGAATSGTSKPAYLRRFDSARTLVAA